MIFMSDSAKSIDQDPDQEKQDPDQEEEEENA